MATKNKTARPTKNTAAAKAKAKAAKAQAAAQQAAQAAQADLLAAMQAAHAARKPAGQGPRHGRHAKPRMPNTKSLHNFYNTVQAAIAAQPNGAKGADRIVVLAAHGTWGPFAKTWLSNQHGWYQDQSCARCAVALGFIWARGMAVTGKINPRVTLRPVDPVAFAKDPAGYVKANLAAVVGGAQ
jgi:hypothetical protein